MADAAVLNITVCDNEHQTWWRMMILSMGDLDPI